ncbi:MAG: rhomboid family intramembrane serine protease [Congregibacter sp.]
MQPLYRGELGDDLRGLSVLLWKSQIPHRVVEEDGQQVIHLADEADRDRALALVERWHRGEIRVDLKRVEGRPSTASPSTLRVLYTAPMTAALIALSIAGFLLIYLLAPVEWIAQLTYGEFEVRGGRPVFVDADAVSRQWWRLITPAFLHFGWMHIVFNSLWCWELGRRIESRLGSRQLIGLFWVIAAVSTFAQHVSTGPSLFGGLSGVVYGLLGFAWVGGRLNPDWRSMAPANPIMLFMVGWLVICLLGVVNVLGFSVANAAHLGGLICGALLGGSFAVVFRAR